MLVRGKPNCSRIDNNLTWLVLVPIPSPLKTFHTTLNQTMPPSPRIPPLLHPHIQLPSVNSILLLTSTLGASANWLIIRFLCDALSSEPKYANENAALGDGKDESSKDIAVVLVSWLRDWEFWRQETRKGAGLDLERLKERGRVAFVDGLGGLFLGSVGGDEKTEQSTPGMSTAAARSTPIPAVAARAPQILPVRGPAGRVPARTLGSATPATTIATAETSASPKSHTASTPQSHKSPKGHYTLTNPSLSDLQKTIQTALSGLTSVNPQRKTLLILDSPDALLATTGLPTSSLTSTLLDLHLRASHILVHLYADDALLAPSTPPQPLEISGHNFLVKTAHMSRRILSCRVLDTGVARDVSGVLRITDNGYGVDGSWGLQVRKETDKEEKSRGNRELLYFVRGDGSVQVFERGAGG